MPLARGSWRTRTSAGLCGEHQRLAGDVGVGGAGAADPLDHVAAQDPEVGDREAARLLEHAAVDEADDPAAEPPVAARLLALEAAEDDVVALERLVDQQEQLVGRVLQVVVHGDDVVAGGLAQAGEVGVVLAVVAQQVEGDDVRRAAGAVGDDVPAPVAAAVVDQHDLVAQARGLEDLDDPVDGRADEVLAVVDRDHDGVGEGRRVGSGRDGHPSEHMAPRPAGGKARPVVPPARARPAILPAPRRSRRQEVAMRGSRSSRAHAWSPARHAWRSAWGHRRGQAVALLAISALITACTAFAPVYDRAMQQALVDTLLAQATPAEATVTLVSESSDFAGGASDSRDPREVEALIPDDVAARLGPPVLGRTAIVTPTTGEVPPSGLLLWRDGCVRARTRGERQLPGRRRARSWSARRTSTTSASGPARSARSTRRIDGAGRRAARGRRHVRPATTTAWWQGQRTVGISGIVLGLDPSANHDAWLTVEQTFVDAPILTGETSQAGAPVLHRRTADVDGLVALGEGVREIAGTLDLRGAGPGAPHRPRRADRRPRHAGGPGPPHRAAAARADGGALRLRAVAGAHAPRPPRDAGRSRWRGCAVVARPGRQDCSCSSSCPPSSSGVVPGALVALAGGAVVRSLLPGESPFEAGPGFATAVLLASAAVVVTTLAAAARTAREPLHDVVRSGPVASGRWALGAVEAFVVACVGTGVVAFATGSLQGPLALAGPALLALLTGLLLAHLAAPAGRALGRRLLGQGSARRGHEPARDRPPRPRDAP